MQPTSGMIRIRIEHPCKEILCLAFRSKAEIAQANQVIAISMADNVLSSLFCPIHYATTAGFSNLM